MESQKTLVSEEQTRDCCTKNSSLKIEVNQTSPEEWDRYVEGRAQATFHHCYKWRDVLEKNFGFRPYYLACRDGDKIVGILPMMLQKSLFFGRKLYSLPVVDYGGILADTTDAVQILADKAHDIAEKERVDYLQLRHFKEMDLESYVTCEEKVTFWMDLDRPLDDIWKSFKSGGVRTPVKKARKEGFEARWGGAELLDDFYRIQCQNMHYHGTPVYPRKFFAAVLESFPEQAEICTVYHNDQAISSALVLHYRDYSQSPWAGSLYYEPIRPNDFMYWQIVERCHERGSKVFDFGRCSKGSGTYQFKKKWTKDIHQLYFQHYLVQDDEVSLPGTSKTQHLMIETWKKLPLWLANLLGPMVSHNVC